MTYKTPKCVKILGFIVYYSSFISQGYFFSGGMGRGVQKCFACKIVKVFPQILRWEGRITFFYLTFKRKILAYRQAPKNMQENIGPECFLRGMGENKQSYHLPAGITNVFLFIIVKLSGKRFIEKNNFTFFVSQRDLLFWTKKQIFLKKR